jgi:nicotinamide-nucleotide amidase
MKYLFSNNISSFIQRKFNHEFIEHRTLLTAGIGESYLAEKIQHFEQQIPSNIKLAYLPNHGMVRLRLSGTGANQQKLQQQINHQFNLLKKEVKDFLVIDEDISLEKALGNILLSKNKTIATAESCTGGLIAGLITSVAGASNYFNGSVVSYANEVKKNILHVAD